MTLFGHGKQNLLSGALVLPFIQQFVSPWGNKLVVKFYCLKLYLVLKWQLGQCKAYSRSKTLKKKKVGHSKGLGNNRGVYFQGGEKTPWYFQLLLLKSLWHHPKTLLKNLQQIFVNNWRLMFEITVNNSITPLDNDDLCILVVYQMDIKHTTK